MRRQRQHVDPVACGHDEPSGHVRIAPGIGRPGSGQARGRNAKTDGCRGREASGIDEQDSDRRLGTVRCFQAEGLADQGSSLDRERRLADTAREREQADEPGIADEVRQDRVVGRRNFGR